MAFKTEDIQTGYLDDLGRNCVSPGQAASQKANVRRFVRPERDGRARRKRFADPLTYRLKDKYPELRVFNR